VRCGNKDPGIAAILNKRSNIKAVRMLVNCLQHQRKKDRLSKTVLIIELE
jgi:hypothetical protein